MRASAPGIHGQAHGGAVAIAREWANDAGDEKAKAIVSPQGRAASHSEVSLHGYESADVLLERLRSARTQCSSLAVLEGLDHFIT